MLQSPDPGIWLMLIIKALAWNSKQLWREMSGMSALFQITQRCDYTTINMSFHITLSPLWLKGRLSAQRLSIPLFSSCRHLGHQRLLFLTLAERQKHPSEDITEFFLTCRLTYPGSGCKRYGNESNIWKCSWIMWLLADYWGAVAQEVEWVVATGVWTFTWITQALNVI